METCPKCGYCPQCGRSNDKPDYRGSTAVPLNPIPPSYPSTTTVTHSGPTMLTASDGTVWVSPSLHNVLGEE